MSPRGTHPNEDTSLWEAICSVVEKRAPAPEMRTWVRRAEIDDGTRPP
jgi:hypothetical protein